MDKVYSRISEFRETLRADDWNPARLLKTLAEGESNE
jgi:hypothetical protein